MPSKLSIGVRFVAFTLHIFTPFALSTNKNFWNLGSLDLGTRQVNPCEALTALYHRAASKWSFAETGNKVIRVLL